jgi:hypothetical protein
MQGLAEDLGVSPATLYSHVAGRDEVIALVESRLDHAIRGFATEATEWRGWLTDFAGLVRRELGSSASTVLTATRDEASMRIDVGEPGLRLLMAAGFSSVEAAYAVWLVVRVAITASSGAEASFSRFLEPTAELVDAAADADTYAALRQVHDDLTTSDVHDTFAFDLEIVLDGIAARLGPPDAPQPDHQGRDVRRRDARRRRERRADRVPPSRGRGRRGDDHRRLLRGVDGGSGPSATRS